MQSLFPVEWPIYEFEFQNSADNDGVWVSEWECFMAVVKALKLLPDAAALSIYLFRSWFLSRFHRETAHINKSMKHSSRFASHT